MSPERVSLGEEGGKVVILYTNKSTGNVWWNKSCEEAIK